MLHLLFEWTKETHTRNNACPSRSSDKCPLVNLTVLIFVLRRRACCVCWVFEGRSPGDCEMDDRHRHHHPVGDEERRCRTLSRPHPISFKGQCTFRCTTENVKLPSQFILGNVDSSVSGATGQYHRVVLGVDSTEFLMHCFFTKNEP